MEMGACPFFLRIVNKPPPNDQEPLPESVRACFFLGLCCVSGGLKCLMVNLLNKFIIGAQRMPQV